MVRTVYRRHLDVHHGIAGQDARLQRFPTPFSTAGIYSLGIRAAHDLVHEDKARAALHGLQLQPDVAILAVTAGLPDEAALGLARPGDRLAVGHLGLPMLASTLNSRSMRSTITSRCSSPMPEITVWPVSWSVRTLKVGILFRQALQGLPILSWSALVFGSTATEITGSGNLMVSSRIWSPGRTGCRR